MWWLVVAAGFGVLAFAHTAPFPFLLEYAGPGRSVWHVPRVDGAPTIYLTFDDGPNPDATPGLLDVLARESVPATFFVIPKHMNARTAPILRRALDDGHGVALHSHTRALLLKHPTELEQLLADQAADIERLAGRPPCQLFRPHAGWRGGQMYAGLARAGYTLAGLELRHVGLELVAAVEAGKTGRAARRPRLGRRHRRHARRPSRESARRSRADGGRNRRPDSASQSERVSASATCVRRSGATCAAPRRTT